jgi:hypothetical protein
MFRLLMHCDCCTSNPAVGLIGQLTSQPRGIGRDGEIWCSHKRQCHLSQDPVSRVCGGNLIASRATYTSPLRTSFITMSHYPLNTIFLPPSSCLNTQIIDSGINVLGPAATDSSVTQCFPSGWATGSSNYFSPALCPEFYTGACTSTNTDVPGSTETVVTCCPGSVPESFN